jgi:hypothetical protein
MFESMARATSLRPEASPDGSDAAAAADVDEPELKRRVGV